jgi:hypothetical protein
MKFSGYLKYSFHVISCIAIHFHIKKFTFPDTEPVTFAHMTQSHVYKGEEVTSQTEYHL